MSRSKSELILAAPGVPAHASWSGPQARPGAVCGLGRAGKADRDRWQHDGLQAFVEADIIELAGVYDIAELAFDRTFAGEIVQNLQDEGVKLVEPAPGFGEKYWSLSGFPSHSLASGGGGLLTVIFGQIFAYSVFSNSHFSSPGSVSALIASTGHSGSHTPQSMHSSGWMTSMFSPS